MMVRNRYQGLWPGWTGSRGSSTTPDLSTSCKESLKDIVRAFLIVNDLNTLEVERDLLECEGNRQAKLQDPKIRWRTKSHFSNADLDTLLEYKKSMNQALSSNWLELQLVLLDTSYMRLWRLAVDSQLSYTSEYTGHLFWNLSKQRSRDFLEQRDTIAELFEEVNDELWMYAPGVHRAIRARIRLLERFTTIYNRQPEDKEQPEPRWQLYPLNDRPRKRAAAVNAYEVHPNKTSSTLTAVVSVATLAATIPMGFAWTYSSNIQGFITDADFYLLIQSSVMNILGIFTSIYSIPWHPHHASQQWSGAFALLGFLCAFAAIPMYLYLPTQWSALVSFLGTAIQSFMILQLAINMGVAVSQVKTE